MSLQLGPETKAATSPGATRPLSQINTPTCSSVWPASSLTGQAPAWEKTLLLELTVFRPLICISRFLCLIRGPGEAGSWWFTVSTGCKCDILVSESERLTFPSFLCKTLIINVEHIGSVLFSFTCCLLFSPILYVYGNYRTAVDDKFELQVSLISNHNQP